ncbi:MAG: metal-dependent hydrolase [Terracidiphilus sp.]|jgi:inner membrane protein
MEPVTHFLAGACIGRAGLNRKTAYATLAAVLAAEAADLDVLWSFAGPVEELKHHRGITHTFIAVPVVAGVVVGIVWLLHRWREGRRKRRAAASAASSVPILPGAVPDERTPVEVRGLPRSAAADQKKGERMGHGALVDPGAPSPMLPQPVHWSWLYATALIAALSHLLLDWTNNYGLRPFFPFNPRWYAGSFMFIAEPVLWALFSAALIVPWLLGLADAEIGARRKAFRGRGWAIFALTGMVLLSGWRWMEQKQARAMLENTQVAAAPVKRVALEPYPVNPFRWHAIIETADFYQTAEIDTRSGEIASDPRQDVLYKPPVTAATEAARRTPLGQVYLDWGTWAVVRDVGQEPVAGMQPPEPGPNRTWTTVEFTDLRFAYSYMGTGRTGGRSPLSGWVYIVDGRDDAGEAMGGREQR